MFLVIGEFLNSFELVSGKISKPCLAKQVVFVSIHILRGSLIDI